MTRDMLKKLKTKTRAKLPKLSQLPSNETVVAGTTAGSYGDKKKKKKRLDEVFDV